MRNLLLASILIFCTPSQALPLEGGCDPQSFIASIVHSSRASEVQKLLSEAVSVLKKDPHADLTDLSKKLLQTQSELLKEKGVHFKINADGTWLDILPLQHGPSLNQLAYTMAHESVPSFLRYHPSMLFEDAYGLFDSILYHRNRAIYLSHHDLFDAPASEYFNTQMKSGENFRHYYQQMSRHPDPDIVISNEAFNRQYRAPLTEKDYATNWHKDPFVNPVTPFEKMNESQRINLLLHDYFKKTPDLVMVLNHEDPIVSRIGPFRRMSREQYNTPLTDVNGVTKLIYDENKFRVSELRGPAHLSEKSVYDIFLTDAVRDRFHDASRTYRRALVLPDGRTLVHLSGTEETRPYFESYFDFLEKIYRDPKGLNISEKTFHDLKAKSLEMSQQSELITRTKTKEWLQTHQAKDVNGGMILVKSENASQKLPIRDLHPELNFAQPANEVWVEAGRLGSLTAEETIQFLKVAGASLHYQYPDKTVRIICEANASRAQLFKKFGFSKAPVKVASNGYYPDGEEFVLHVTLEEFLKRVLK